MSDTRRCVCGAMLIPADQLSVTDTDIVHRHGGPCYVDETRTDVVERAREALEVIDPERWVYTQGVGPVTNFIAAAPALVADLTAEVETLRAALGRGRELIDQQTIIADTLSESDDHTIGTAATITLSLLARLSRALESETP